MSLDHLDAMDEETEVQMMLRIEAEERARLEQQDMHEPSAQPPKTQHDGSRSKVNALASRCTCFGHADNGSSVATKSAAAIAKDFAILGSLAFGGSSAQVSLMRSQDWRIDVASEGEFASLFALVQCLPGFSPAQLATALGILQGGATGGLVALAGYAASSTSLLTILGTWTSGPAENSIVTSLQMGIGASAVALVAKTGLELVKNLPKEPVPPVLCVMAAAVAVGATGMPWALAATLCFAAVISAVDSLWQERRGSGGGGGDAAAMEDSRESSKGLTAAVDEEETREAIREGRDPQAIATTHVPMSRHLGLCALALWITLLLLLVLVRALGVAPWWLRLFESGFRSGSLVYGSGWGTVPLVLQEALPSLITPAAFLQGSALALATPGPNVFGLGAYVGAVYAGPFGAFLFAASLHLPGALLVYAALPYWSAIRSSMRFQAVLRGVNAASAGLVVAAAILLLEQANTPPQHTISVLTFASLHTGWPGARLRLAPRYHPPLTVALGATLGIPICLPWLLSRGAQPHGAAAGAATTGSTQGMTGHSTHKAPPPSIASPPMPPPPPSPQSPDPSPPPPPLPYPPDDDDD